jgi:hypothetical protein
MFSGTALPVARTIQQKWLQDEWMKIIQDDKKNSVVVQFQVLPQQLSAETNENHEIDLWVFLYKNYSERKTLEV